MALSLPLSHASTACTGRCWRRCIFMAKAESVSNSKALQSCITANNSATKRCLLTSRRVACTSAAALLALLLSSSPAVAAAEPEAFTRSCAGCHAGGGNVVQAGATLFTTDLQRNGAGDANSIYEILYSGKNKMPGFGKNCAPRGACTFGPRLGDQELQGLTSYVLERAAEGWK